MSILSRLKLFHVLHTSRPSQNRTIYQEIHRRGVRKFVELGVGTGQRALQMIELAGMACDPAEIHYTGIDLFEARTEAEGPWASLRDIYQLLKPTGAKIRLVPGTPLEGLARVANALGQVDMVICSFHPAADWFTDAWFYVPRLLNATSDVFLESADTDGKASFRRVPRDEILNLTQARRRAA